MMCPVGNSFAANSYSRRAFSLILAATILFIGMQSASAFTDTMTFSEADYTEGQNISGKDGWFHYASQGNGDHFKVQGLNGAAYLNVTTSGGTAMDRQMNIRGGIIDMKWQWRASDLSALAVIGPATGTTGTWSGFKIRAGTDSLGRMMVSGRDGPSNAKWPVRKPDVWYYMRLRMDFTLGRYTYHMDTLSDRSSEITLHGNGVFDTTAVDHIMIKANGYGTSLDIDQISWEWVFPKIWDGGAGDGNWSSAANWSDDMAPGIGDAVFFNASSSKNCVLDGNAEVHSIHFSSGYLGIFDFGAGTLRLSGNGDFSSGGIFQTSDEGAVELSGSSLQYLYSASNGALPAIKHTGSGTLRLGKALLATAFRQTAGVLDLNGFNLTLTGSLAIENGTSASLANLAGRILTVGGDATLSGQSGNFLNLNAASAWTLSVTGSLRAYFATLAHANAAKSQGVAANSTDAGNNANWLFSSEGPPVITTHPAPQTVTPGQTAVFKVSVVGTQPITYQWKRGDSAIAGATDTIYTLANAQIADNGALFRCVVTNGLGSATSSTAKLTVSDLPIITLHPGEQRAVIGATAVFKAEAVSSTALSYQWLRNGSIITGATAVTLSITVQQADHGTDFSCSITNGSGSVTTQTARLSVLACGEEFSAPGDTAVDEDVELDLVGVAGCGSQAKWLVVGGPAPPIVDPSVRILRVQVPRISSEAQLFYRFMATYDGGETWKVRDVKVGVKNSIPDPVFSLPTLPEWDGKDSLSLVPLISNLDSVLKSQAPKIRYQWTVTGLGLDTLVGSDRLVLRRPKAGGALAIKLCLDNGGPVGCLEITLTVKVAATSPSRSFINRNGPAVEFRGQVLIWRRAARIRIWSHSGRLVFDFQAPAGYQRAIPFYLLTGIATGKVTIQPEPN